MVLPVLLKFRICLAGKAREISRVNSYIQPIFLRLNSFTYVSNAIVDEIYYARAHSRCEFHIMIASLCFQT